MIHKREFAFRNILRNKVKFFEQLSTRRNQSAENSSENIKHQVEDIMLSNFFYFRIKLENSILKYCMASTALIFEKS